MKRIIICTLCLVLCFSIYVYADDINSGELIPQHENIYKSYKNDAGYVQDSFNDMQNGALGAESPDSEITIPYRSNMPDFQPQDKGNMSQMPPDGENAEAAEDDKRSFPPDNAMGERPRMGDFPNMSREYSEETNVDSPQSAKNLLEEYFTPILSLILLAFAFVFVSVYKRRTF